MRVLNFSLTYRRLQTREAAISYLGCKRTVVFLLHSCRL